MSAIVKSRPKPKLLIADDDPAVVNLLADQCGKMGFQVTTASNGMMLLFKACQTEPDALIIDVNMPGLDGLSASTHVIGPHNKPINAIVMTGSSSEEVVERCESLGMYYSRKGPGFWRSVETALIQIFPDMADNIKQRTTSPTKQYEVP